MHVGAHHLQWIPTVPPKLHLILHRQPQQCSDNLVEDMPKLLPEPRPRAVGRVWARRVFRTAHLPIQKAAHQVAWMLPFRYGYLDLVILTRITPSY